MCTVGKRGADVVPSNVWLLLVLAPAAVAASPALADLDAMIVSANAIDITAARNLPAGATVAQALSEASEVRRARAKAVGAAVAMARELRARVTGAEALEVDARLVDVYVAWREALAHGWAPASAPEAFLERVYTQEFLAEMDAGSGAQAAVRDALGLAEGDATLALDAWRLHQRLWFGEGDRPIARCVGRSGAPSAPCVHVPERDALIARFDVQTAAEAEAGPTAGGRLAAAERWLAESHATYVAAMRAPWGAPGAASRLWMTGAAWAAAHADQLLESVRRDGNETDAARARDLQAEVLRWQGLVGMPAWEAPPPVLHHEPQE
jgi:hypothetical protein